MSVMSWMEEFYTDAEDCKTDLEAIEQGLNKFIGARKENLIKHGIIFLSGYYPRITDDINRFTFSGPECGLCILYFHDKPSCNKCPINMDNKNNQCDMSGSPYYIFCETHDPEPMIKLLTRLKEELK